MIDAAPGGILSVMEWIERERRERERRRLILSVGTAVLVLLALLQLIESSQRRKLERALGGWTVESFQERYAIQLAVLRDYATRFDDYWDFSGPDPLRPMWTEAKPLFSSPEILHAGVRCGEEGRGVSVYSRTPKEFQASSVGCDRVGPENPALSVFDCRGRWYVSYEEALYDERGRELVVELRVWHDLLGEPQVARAGEVDGFRDSTACWDAAR